jgi:phospholipase C
VVFDEDFRTGDIVLTVRNTGSARLGAIVRDNAYGRAEQRLAIAGGAMAVERISLGASARWYDLAVLYGPLSYRAAGHVENGRESTTDPAQKAPVVL